MAVLLGAIDSKPKKIIVAASKKNQSNIDKAIYWGFKYNQLNDLRNAAYDKGDERLERKLDRQCEVAFDKHLDYMGELPKGEQKRVDKLIFG